MGGPPMSSVQEAALLMWYNNTEDMGGPPMPRFIRHM
jgi:hypothetical protein